jgi:hypothetical protein
VTENNLTPVAPSPSCQYIYWHHESSHCVQIPATSTLAWHAESPCMRDDVVESVVPVRTERAPSLRPADSYMSLFALAMALCPLLSVCTVSHSGPSLKEVHACAASAVLLRPRTGLGSVCRECRAASVVVATRLAWSHY